MNDTTDWQAQSSGLADQLHALRLGARLSGKDMAELLGWQSSKVSRLQSGKQRPSEADVLAWTKACQASQETTELILATFHELRAVHRDWRQRARAGHGSVQLAYNELVEAAAAVREFAMAFIPGLLQTPAYARRIFTEMRELHGLENDNPELAVANRMERQRYLYNPSKTFEFILAEPVLLWGIAEPEVMRQQLDRLLTAATLPNVRFGILPLRAPLSLTPQNSFTLYGEVAILETFTAETICRDEESALYRRVMERMWTQTLEGPAARKAILEAMESLPPTGE